MDSNTAAQNWLAAFETWENDPDSARDGAHVRKLAALAQAGKLPCYLDGQHDAGAAGWAQIAEKYNKKGVRPAADLQPAPWEL